MIHVNNQVKKTLTNIKYKENNPIKQYRILNKNGLIYSQHLGWVELNKKVYGHIFNKEEVHLVLEVLKEYGYYDSYIEVDKVGSLFVKVLDSPFGNPMKFIHLLIITVIIFSLFYFIVKFNIFDTNGESPVYESGELLLKHLESQMNN